MTAGLNGCENSALDAVSSGMRLSAQIGVSVDASEYDVELGETVIGCLTQFSLFKSRLPLMILSSSYVYT